MFQVNDYIVYGNLGVCRVVEIGIPSFFQDSQKRYYTLEPLYQKGNVFVPVDTDLFMRPVLTKEEAEELISMIPSVSSEVYVVSNMQELTQQYSAKLHSHDLQNLISLISSIYQKKQARMQNNQKIGSVDEAYMKKAETLLYGELAVALGIDIKEVPDYIASKIK